ncbi:MAG: TetR/AcrR family transcriptional regulator [Actinobacteria bacterium]|nr:TetR/AcrR family transcriptional regulator [Actinomycetota bacterium]
MPEIAGAKTRRGAVTRARLVDAAAAVFAEYGYNAARISDMVRLAGISQGNFYRHFQSKDEVLLAVIEGPLDELRRVSSVHSGADATDVVLADLVAANRAYFSTYARHRHVIRVMREAAATNAEFGRLWLQIRRGFVERTVHWLERLQAAGRLEPGANLELLGEALGSVVEHLAYVQIALQPELPRGEMLDDLGRVAGEAWFLILTGRERLTKTRKSR